MLHLAQLALKSAHLVGTGVWQYAYVIKTINDKATRRIE